MGKAYDPSQRFKLLNHYLLSSSHLYCSYLYTHTFSPFSLSIYIFQWEIRLSRPGPKSPFNHIILTLTSLPYPIIACLIVGIFMSWQHQRSYQDRYRLVSTHTRGELIVLPNWGIPPDIPLSNQIILALS